jgi:hypothetical protein
MVQPRVLSYDHYALLDDGTTRPGYYDNLEVIRRKALEHRTPFWQIILLTPHFNYRDPSEADLRWQAYTTLAYGGKGLSYFTYWTPNHANYRNAIIDPFGYRTHHYAWVRRINREIQNIGPTLLTLTSQRVYRIEAGVPEPFGIVRAVEDGSFVVGEFVDRDGMAYFLLVNCNLERSAFAQVELTGEAADVCEVNRVTGGLYHMQEEGAITGQQLSVRLAPGDGRLFRLA